MLALDSNYYLCLNVFLSLKPFFIMKKILFVLMAFVAINTTQAQNEDFRSNVGLNVGYGLFNILDAALSAADDTLNLGASVSALPQLSLTYDYSIRQWFSIGGSVSYGNLAISDDSYTVTQVDSLGNWETITGSYSTNLSRISVGARALFHYGNSGRLDMYSGIRLGASIWGANVESSTFDIEDLPEDVSGRSTGVLPNVHFILFGIRGYVTENIGIGGEICAGGAPHIAALNVNYRF
jgi:hypothetical protein